MSKFISLTGLSEFLTKCKALFYTKPNGGVPKTDLAQSVQTSLGKADSAYQKPNSGIPKTDLASGIQSSLDLADSSVQANPVGSVTPAVDPYDYATREEVSQLGQEVSDIEEVMPEFGNYVVAESGWISSSDGQATTAHPEYSRIIDYIPISGDETITMTGNSGEYGKRYYDAEKNYLGSSYSASASFVRVTFILATGILLEDVTVTVGGTVTYFCKRYQKLASEGEIGGLNNLTTTAKSSLVAAINEHDSEIGNLSGLYTTDKTKLTLAINELYTRDNGMDANTATVWCETAADVAQKEVTMPTSWVKSTNIRWLIRFRNGNTANNVTLKINNTDAKEFYYNGSPASSSNCWQAREWVDVFNNQGAQYMGVSHANLLQSIGQSVIDTMSQKAITDAINASAIPAYTFNNLPSANGKNAGVIKSNNGGMMWSDDVVWRWAVNNKIVMSAKGYKTVKVSDETAIAGNNETTVYPIASMTKLISALVATRYISNWNDTYTLDSIDDVSPEKTSFVHAGDTATFETLLNSSIIQSDNNAAQALMKPVGYMINPSATTDAQARSAFLSEMASVCSELGMANTARFNDACSTVTSTAEDMCKLILYIQKNVTAIKNVWGKLNYTVVVIRDGVSVSIDITSTTNADARALIPEFIGGKTGTLTLLTYGWVWESEEDNELYVSVLLDSSSRWKDARQIIDEIYSS